MRWYNKRLVGASTLALMLGGCGVFGGHRSDARPERGTGGSPITDNHIVQDEVATIGDPYTIGGQRYEPKDDNMFDEVGYGIVKSDELAGSNTSMGESYNPSSIVAAHRILPVPSYVEVTHLDTGKTILVRVNDRGPMVKDRIIALSSSAARALGMDATGSAPLRVRRVNPPIQEKGMLRSGGMAPDRLDTPSSLLSALKRRLSETTAGKPADLVSGPAPAPIGRPADVIRTGPNGRPVVASRASASAPIAKPARISTLPPVARASSGRPGADFDVGRPSAARAPVTPARVARPVSPVPQQAPSRSGNDRFVIEDGNGQRTVVTTTGAVNVVDGERGQPAQETPQAVSGTWFVQIASFGDAGRARALASRTGGSVQRVGNVYRVRTGPYADQSSAHTALSQAVSKGYRDARIAK
jgi:rare lipoprotein A